MNIFVLYALTYRSISWLFSLLIIRRAFTNTFRSRGAVFTRTFQLPLLAFYLLLFFGRLGDDQRSIQNRNGLILETLVEVTLASAVAAISLCKLCLLTWILMVSSYWYTYQPISCAISLASVAWAATSKYVVFGVSFEWCPTANYTTLSPPLFLFLGNMAISLLFHSRSLKVSFSPAKYRLETTPFLLCLWLRHDNVIPLENSYIPSKSPFLCSLHRSTAAGAIPSGVEWRPVWSCSLRSVLHRPFGSFQRDRQFPLDHHYVPVSVNCSWSSLIPYHAFLPPFVHSLSQLLFQFF